MSSASNCSYLSILRCLNLEFDQCHPVHLWLPRPSSRADVWQGCACAAHGARQAVLWWAVAVWWGWAERECWEPVCWSIAEVARDHAWAVVAMTQTSMAFMCKVLSISCLCFFRSVLEDVISWASSTFGHCTLFLWFILFHYIESQLLSNTSLLLLPSTKFQHFLHFSTCSKSCLIIVYLSNPLLSSCTEVDLGVWLADVFVSHSLFVVLGCVVLAVQFRENKCMNELQALYHPTRVYRILRVAYSQWLWLMAAGKTSSSQKEEKEKLSLQQLRKRNTPYIN